MDTIIHITKNLTRKNFRSPITKIENVLEIWKMRQLTLEGRIKLSESLPISKIVYLALTNSIPAEIIIDFLHKIQKGFL